MYTFNGLHIFFFKIFVFQIPESRSFLLLQLYYFIHSSNINPFFSENVKTFFLLLSRTINNVKPSSFYNTFCSPHSSVVLCILLSSTVATAVSSNPHVYIYTGQRHPYTQGQVWNLWYTEVR